LALAQSRKNLDQIVQLYNVVYDFLNQQLPTKNINSSLVSQLTGLRNQLYNDLVTGLVIPNSSEGIALKAHLALGLTEVPEQITAPLAKDVLDFVLTLVNLADSSTLGTLAQILSNLLEASQLSGFTSGSGATLEEFGNNFNETLSELAGMLVQSAIPGQQAVELTTTLSGFTMINFPTPPQNGFVYVQSKRDYVNNLVTAYNYGGVNLNLPFQPIVASLQTQSIQVVDTSFVVLNANPYVYTPASLGINSGVVELLIQSNGELVSIGDLSQSVNISIPLITPVELIADRLDINISLAGQPSVVCVAWQNGDWNSSGCTTNPGTDAPGYSITQCKCSFISSAYATVYQWAGEIPISVDISDVSSGASTSTFLSTDLKVLLAVFGAVAVISMSIILLRIHYNHRKRVFLMTTEEQLLTWNLARGNDLTKGKNRQAPVEEPKHEAHSEGSDAEDLSDIRRSHTPSMGRSKRNLKASNEDYYSESEGRSRTPSSRELDHSSPPSRESPVGPQTRSKKKHL